MINPALSFAYTIGAILVAGLLVYVIQKVETDRWSKLDPLWLQWVRRAAFFATAIVVLYSIESTDWQLTSFLFVIASAVILILNAMALSFRAPPNDKGKARSASYSVFHLVARRVAHYFSAHR
jgi:hypothetical protein